MPAHAPVVLHGSTVDVLLQLLLCMALASVSFLLERVLSDSRVEDSEPSNSCASEKRPLVVHPCLRERVAVRTVLAQAPVFRQGSPVNTCRWLSCTASEALRRFRPLSRTSCKISTCSLMNMRNAACFSCCVLVHLSGRRLRADSGKFLIQAALTQPRSPADAGRSCSDRPVVRCLPRPPDPADAGRCGSTNPRELDPTIESRCGSKERPPGLADAGRCCSATIRQLGPAVGGRGSSEKLRHPGPADAGRRPLSGCAFLILPPAGRLAMSSNTVPTAHKSDDKRLEKDMDQASTSGLAAK